MTYSGENLIDWLEDFLGFKGRKLDAEDKKLLLHRGLTKREVRQGIIDRNIQRRAQGKAPYSVDDHAVMQHYNDAYAGLQARRANELFKVEWKIRTETWEGRERQVTRDARGRFARAD